MRAQAIPSLKPLIAVRDEGAPHPSLRERRNRGDAPRARYSVGVVSVTVDGWPVEIAHHPGEGPPLVLMHGAGANAEVWAPVARELTAFDVYAPSLPGRGGSGGPAFEEAISAGAWLARVIAALGGPPPIVVGHSLGGGIVLELALLGAPIAGLVLVATGARLRVHPSVLAAAARAVETDTPMSTRFAFVDASQEAIDAYEAAASNTPPRATVCDWAVCQSFDRIGALSAIELPCLVLGGAADLLTPAKYQHYLAGALPRAQLVLMDGRGHMLPWEDPQGFARQARVFASAC